MATYTYKDRINPLNSPVGGGTDNSKVNPQLAKDMLILDKIAYCGRMQMIASDNRAAWTSWSDTRPDAPYLFLNNNWRLLSEIYYYLPDVLPGSKNRTSSTGTSTAERGFLVFGFIGRDFNAAAQIDLISYGGSYGQSSTISSKNFSSVLNSTGGEAAAYLSDSSGGSNYVLLPAGAIGGDLIRITLWGGTGVFGGRGYIRSWNIGEPYVIANNP